MKLLEQDTASTRRPSELGQPRAVGLAGELAEGGDGVVEHDFRQAIHFQQIQGQGGGPDFEQQAGGQDVGVAMQEVEAAVLAGVGRRFVAGVDDGAVN